MHLGISQAPGHRRAGRTGADNQDVNGIVLVILVTLTAIFQGDSRNGLDTCVFSGLPARQKGGSDGYCQLREPFTQEANQTTEDQIGLDKGQRRDVQRRLNGLGFDTKVTGKFDESTRAVITRWQAARGYPRSGFLNKLQHKALLTEIVATTQTSSSEVRAVTSLPRWWWRRGWRRSIPPAGPGGLIGGMMGGLLGGRR